MTEKTDLPKNATTLANSIWVANDLSQPQHQGIFVVDLMHPDKIVLDVNEAFCEHCGCHREEIIGKPLNRVLGLRKSIHHPSTHDMLTKLPNRALLAERFHEAASRVNKQNTLMGMLFVDLDRFKFINDTYGHQVGDHLLFLVAQRLQKHTRVGDTVARIGGDEFIVLLPNLQNTQDGEMIAESILHSVSQPYAIHNKQYMTSASVGLCFYPRDGNTFELLMEQADSAMYQAKDKGRNTVCSYTIGNMDRISKRAKIENELRDELKRHEVELLYQPIVHLQTSKIVAVEVVLHWLDKSLNEISNRHLMKIAEESHLMTELGEWMLETVCRQAQEICEKIPMLNIAMNLSKSQWYDPRFIEQLIKVLTVSHLNPRNLLLEIQECDLREDEKVSRATINKLREFGIQICLDGFGDLSSNISALKQLPMDQIKIDPVLVGDMLNSQADATLIEAIVMLGRGFHIAVVAEGVDSEAKRQFLMEHGCEFGQGTQLSAPLRFEDLRSYLDRSN